MGKIIALSIIHGGPGPVFLSPAVVDYLFGGISAIKAIIEVLESIEEFRDLLSSYEYEFRYTCGVAKPSNKISLEEKPKIIGAMCLHFTISLAELEQLCRGCQYKNFLP